MTLTKPQRATLFAMFGGHCAYCGCLLPEKGWQADHIEAIQRESVWVRIQRPNTYATHKMVPTGKCLAPENDHLGNLFPSCRACNINKGPTPLEVWRKCLEHLVDCCRRDHSQFRHAERFGLVAQVETKIVFYFEKVGAQ